MADVTNVFKATVKSIKSRNRGINKDAKTDDKSSIFPASKNRGQFETAAKDVIKTVSTLKEFLLKHRKDYVNAGSHLSGEASHMTDTEREEIDTEAQNIIKKCQDSLGKVKKNAECDRVHPQVKEHRDVVLALINTYLKAVCKIYSEQKAVRVKRVVDRKRIARIEPERRSLLRQQSRSQESIDDSATSNNNSLAANIAANAQQSTNPALPPVAGTARIEPERRSLLRQQSRSQESMDDSTASSNNSLAANISANAQQSTNPASPVAGASKAKASSQRVPSPDLQTVDDSADEISPEEAQMFELENKEMFEEMNSLSEEVSRIQGKVIEIASLQEIFTEKVLTQEEDIHRIADNAVLSTENVKEGNEEIREAMKKNAGFRVWILFFLLVLTFSLLFLDWYSG